MAEYTRLKNQNTPFRAVKPTGDQGSNEALAQVFGKVAQKSIETATEINNERSNASLYQATNQIYRLKHVIESDFRRMPDQIMPLASEAIKDIRSIVQNTPLNEADRKRLEYLSNNDAVDIEANGIKLSAEYNHTQSKISFVSQWPEKLQQIQDSWSKGEQAVNSQYENAQKILSDALSNKYITQNQYESMHDTLLETIQTAMDTHQLNNDQEADAKKYHRANTKFDVKHNFGQVGAPSNEATNFLYSHQVNQRNFSDVEAALYNDRPVDPLRFINLNKKEREQVKLIRDVINDVKSTFSSGGSWDEMEAVHKSLDNKKDYLLTTEERAAKSYLDNFFDKFGPDKYLSIVSNTPLGASAVHDHNMAVNAIDNNGAYSPEQKEYLKRDYDNQFADKMVSIGISKGIPQDKVMPIPSPVIQEAQKSFDAGGDPMVLLKTMDHYNQRNRIYIAQAMKEPEQKEVTYMVGVLEGKTSNAIRQTLIAANQPGIDWSPLTIGKEGISEVAVRTRVESDKNISDIIKYNSRFRVPVGQERGPALVKSTVNAVKYSSLKRGEYDMKNYDKDIYNMGREYAKAYDIYSGSNYAFNKKQQPQVSDYEWSVLAEHAIAEGHKNMRSINPNASNVDFMQSVDINPLYATITPDNYIVAQDQDGNIAFSAPYSSDLLAYADREIRSAKKKITEEQIKAAKQELSYRGTFK